MKFNQRVWLNPPDSNFTGSAVGYCGPMWWKLGSSSLVAFLEVSDCHQKARLHQNLDTEEDRQSLIFKLNKLIEITTELRDYVQTVTIKPTPEPNRLRKAVKRILRSCSPTKS